MGVERARTRGDGARHPAWRMDPRGALSRASRQRPDELRQPHQLRISTPSRGGWYASFPEPRTFYHVTRGVAGRGTIPGNPAAGEGEETWMGSRAFGGATTRYARIRLIATIPWMRERNRGAVCVKALRPLRGGRCPALTQTATASAFCLRLSGNGSMR